MLIKYLLVCIEVFIQENTNILEKEFLIEILSNDDDDDDADDNIDNYDPNKILFLYPPSTLDYDDYDDDNSGFPGMIRYKYLKIRKFIEYQSDALDLQDKLYEYKILFLHEREDYINLNDNPSVNLSKKECENILSFSINMKFFQKTIFLFQKHSFFLIKKI